MTIIPPVQWTPNTFGAEKITELWDIAFTDLQDAKEWETRVLSYTPNSRHLFGFINITDLLNQKKRTWKTKKNLSLKL